MMTPDYGEARRFLSIIAPDGNAVFQTFDDDEERKDREPDVSKGLARTTRNFDWLKGFNDRRAGVFVTINEVNGDKRTASNIARVRALFADFDGVELPEEWEIQPSLLVSTSPEKYHAYWLCDDFPKEEFPDAQRAIAARYGTDGKICDLPRVMRLPGFWHQKGEAYQVKIVGGDGRKYSAGQLRQWITQITPEKEPEPPPVRRSSLNGGTDPYVKAGVERALSAIALAGKGNRNDTLNSEAYGIFGFVKAGFVPETIRDDIERAAKAIGLTAAEIRATLKSAWTAAKPRQLPERSYARREHVPPHDPETGEVHDDPPKDQPKKEKPRKASFRDMPFRMLGYNKGTYFYLPKRGGQVIELKTHEHTELRLYGVATYPQWQRSIDLKEDETISDKQWRQIAHSLIQAQHDEGIFEETRLRGRGAWMDAKRVVVHTGSEAIIDGDAIALDEVNSRFIYEMAPPWDFGFGNPASDDAAKRLPAICERLTWETKLSGALLAGWCIIAPVCGALAWRPHIWITGSSGSGKTTAQNDIVGRIVGPSAERFDGGTSEAAIRQTLGHDARPAILDEAESEDQDSIKQMQGVLKLARIASSGGKISKGGSSHRAVTFMIRSCFCFSSIHTSLRLQSDESRVTKLILLPNIKGDADKHFRELSRDITAWFTPEYASSMFARTIAHLPTLLANIQTFTQAASIEFKSRRAADQIGAMLAGYFLCLSTRKVTIDEATEFIHKRHWNEHVPLDATTDEMKLFQFIMTRRIRTPMGEQTIGSLLETIKNPPKERDENGLLIVSRIYKDAVSSLAGYGIKYQDDLIYISNDAASLRELFLKDAPQYAGDWKRPLMQIPGASRTPGGTRFGPGLNTRAVVIPYAHMEGNYVEREPGEEG